MFLMLRQEPETPEQVMLLMELTRLVGPTRDGWKPPKVPPGYKEVPHWTRTMLVWVGPDEEGRRIKGILEAHGLEPYIFEK